MELPLSRDGYTCNRDRKDNVLPEIYDKGAYAVVGESWSAAKVGVVIERTAVSVNWYFAGKSWAADDLEVSACWCCAAGT